jgi:hypothetical protein
MGFFGRMSKGDGRVRLGVLATAGAIALGCHYFDEGDSGSSSSSLFEGSFKGTLRVADDSGPRWDDAVCALPAPCIRQLQVDFGPDSEITDVLIDGVSTGYTGTVSFDSSGLSNRLVRLYDFELFDGSGAMVDTGSFYAEDRLSAGMFIYSNGDIAVARKFFGGAPNYRIADLQLKRTSKQRLAVFIRWSAVSTITEVDNWEFSTERLSGGAIPYSGMRGGDVELLPEGGKILVGGEAFDGEFTRFDAAGIWDDFDAALKPEPLIAIMGYAKEFVGTMECDPAVGWPVCIFTIWTPLQKNN